MIEVNVNFRRHVSEAERQSAIQALPPGFTDESQLPSFVAETTLTQVFLFSSIELQILCFLMEKLNIQWPKLARCASSWLRRIRQLHLLFELVVHCADVAKSDSVRFLYRIRIQKPFILIHLLCLLFSVVSRV
jgi:hypothetical protein